MTRDINPPRNVWAALPYPIADAPGLTYPEGAESVTTMADVLDTVTRLTRERDQALADVLSRDAENVALRMTAACDLTDAIDVLGIWRHDWPFSLRAKAVRETFQDRLRGSEAGSWANERDWYISAVDVLTQLLRPIADALSDDERAAWERIARGPRE